MVADDVEPRVKIGSTRVSIFSRQPGIKEITTLLTQPECRRSQHIVGWIVVALVMFNVKFEWHHLQVVVSIKSDA